MIGLLLFGIITKNIMRKKITNMLIEVMAWTIVILPCWMYFTFSGREFVRTILNAITS